MPKGIYDHKKVFILTPKRLEHIKQIGFKKGSKIGLGKKYMLGRKYTLEHRKKMSLSHSGEKNHMWKGDDVGYWGVHHWVTKMLGQPKYCAYCHNEEKKVYHWANISHAYKRDLSDWIRLCVKCHSAYDHGKIKI